MCISEELYTGSDRRMIFYTMRMAYYLVFVLSVCTLFDNFFDTDDDITEYPLFYLY